MQKLWYPLLGLIILCSYFLLYQAKAQEPIKPKIAFVSNRDGQEDIYTMDEDGQNIRRLTFHISNDRWPSWSPDGHKIAFLTDRDADSVIYVMDENGGDLQKLTLGDTASWSPDGQAIVFGLGQGIYIIYLDRKNIRTLTEEGKNMFPVWSPDGQKIAFVSNRDVERNIYVMDDDGKNIQRLTNWNNGVANHPAWSPDGRKIAFDAYNIGEQSHIYIMNADGTNIQRLTDHPAPDFEPVWLDNRRIIFVSDRDGNNEIYVMDMDGSNLHNLTNNPARDMEPSCWPGYFSKWAVTPKDKLSSAWGRIKQ